MKSQAQHRRILTVSSVGNFETSFKGQLISKEHFDVSSNLPKNEIFLTISALASKKRSDQKNKGTLYH